MKITKVPVDNKKQLPIRGGDYFGDPYATVVGIATTKSGKSTVWYNILKAQAYKGLNVIIFASTNNMDPTFDKMVEMLEKKGVNVQRYDNWITDDGTNLIECWMHAKAADAEKKRLRELPKDKDAPVLSVCKFDDPEDSDSDDEPKKKKRKPKFRQPETIFLIDDLSSQINEKHLTFLLTKARHYRAMILISAHSLVNMQKKALEFITHVLAFGKQSHDRVEQLAEKMALSFPTDKKNRSHLHDLYAIATAEPYGFLYIDKFKNQFRSSFNTFLE